MYYYSKRSRSKIVHQSTCQHIQNVSVEDVGSFENLEDAYAAGYRLCRHCSPIAKLYRKESDVLQGYCQSHAASVFFKDRFIGISTPISDWRIIPSGKGNEVVLYHKNTLGDKKTGPVPRYHLQWVSQNTISGYLEYISDHDLYRNMHPLYPVQSKNVFLTKSNLTDRTASFLEEGLLDTLLSKPLTGKSSITVLLSRN